MGAGLSAWFSLGLLSIVVFFFSIPAGVVIGAIVGIPGALLLTFVIDVWASPPRSVRHFVMTLEAIGVAGALMGCSLVIWRYLGVQAATHVAPLEFLNGACAVLLVAIVGRTVGRGLALDHLNAMGIAPPPSRLVPLLRRWRRCFGASQSAGIVDARVDDDGRRRSRHLNT